MHKHVSWGALEEWGCWMSSPAPQGLRFSNPEAPGTAFYRLRVLAGAVWRSRPTGGAVRQAMEVRVIYSGMRHPDPKLGKQGWTAESSTTMGWGGRRWCGAGPWIRAPAPVKDLAVLLWGEARGVHTLAGLWAPSVAPLDVRPGSAESTISVQVAQVAWCGSAVKATS